MRVDRFWRRLFIPDNFGRWRDAWRSVDELRFLCAKISCKSEKDISRSKDLFTVLDLRWTTGEDADLDTLTFPTLLTQR